MCGDGIATEKRDGSCCAVIGGEFYKRYDAKHGKKPPDGAIPCCAPDKITGHWPHWIRISEYEKPDKWFVYAYKNSGSPKEDGTYEAIGPHFQSNPYGMDTDVIEKHGTIILNDVPRTFDGIKKYLSDHYIEGIVFWKDGEPKCKIKRSDFGYEWNVKNTNL